MQYSEVLSAIPQAYVAFQSQNPQLANVNFDYQARAYTLIIERENTEVFRGEIDGFGTIGRFTPSYLRPDVSLTEGYGSMDHLAFNASSILGRFDDMIVPGSGSQANLSSFTRSFTDGTTVSSVLTTLLNEAIGRPNSPVSTLSLGTIQNPIDQNGNPITITSLQFLQGQSYLTWIRALAAIANSDWYLDGTTVNFVNKKGIDRRDSVVWKYRKGEPGNTFKGVRLKLDHTRMANQVTVVGAQNGINVVNYTANPTGVNANSMTNFGIREKIVVARQFDTPTTAQQYAQTTVNMMSETIPIDGLHLYPADDHIIFGNFSLGDTITLDFNFDIVKFRRPIRVMGAVITPDAQGVEVKVHYSIREDA